MYGFDYINIHNKVITFMPLQYFLGKLATSCLKLYAEYQSGAPTNTRMLS